MLTLVGGSTDVRALFVQMQCSCGNAISGDDEGFCGLADDTKIPEYGYL